MLPAPLWLALARAMLVVDDGTRITQLSLHGEGKEEAASPQKRKPTPPRCARQPLPREGARVVIPSFHRKEVPRRGGGWMGGSAVPETKPSPRGEGGERSEPDRVLAVGKRAGKIVSSRQFTRAPERRYAVPLPQWGRLRNENAAIPKT